MPTNPSAVIQVTIERSHAWRRQRALELGSNVAESLQVDVPAAGLSPAARQVLLGPDRANYPCSFSGWYDSKHCFGTARLFGHISLVIDADEPSIEQIDQAIVAAERRLQEIAADRKAKQDAEDERRKRFANHWASLPLHYRVDPERDEVGFCRPTDSNEEYRGQLFSSGVVLYDLDDLRKYVPEALEAAKAEAGRRKEKKKQAAIEAKLRVFDEMIQFLPALPVPRDVVLQAVAATRDALTAREDAAALAALKELDLHLKQKQSESVELE